MVAAWSGNRTAPRSARCVLAASFPIAQAHRPTVGKRLPCNPIVMASCPQMRPLGPVERGSPEHLPPEYHPLSCAVSQTIWKPPGRAVVGVTYISKAVRGNPVLWMERRLWRRIDLSRWLRWLLGKDSHGSRDRFQARPVNSVHAHPPKIGRRVRLFEGHKHAIPHSAVLDVGRVKHHAVAHANACHLLLVRVAERLVECCVHGVAVPGQSAGTLYFEYQVFEAQPSKQQISVTNLVVEVRDAPVKDGGEKIFENVLGYLLRRDPVPLLLDKPRFALFEKPRPVFDNALSAVPV
jgi:hypothetical protein